MEPELIISGNPIDYELAELLGERSADFIVLCFNRVQFERFGTPYDSPRERERTESMVRMLNSRKKKESLWPRMWDNWAGEIRKQYGLPADATADDFRPVASYQIKRVVAVRSEYLHCAIRLFEEIDAKLKTWSVRKLRDGKHLVEIVTAEDRPIMESGESLPLAICKAVVRVLRASPSNVKEHATLSAGASVDHGVGVEVTKEHVNRAADRGCVSRLVAGSFLRRGGILVVG